jgi:hypothetical protein
MAAQERRDAAIFARSIAPSIVSSGADRRTPLIFGSADRDAPLSAVETRLGQSRRNASPRAARSGTRQDVGGAGAARFQEGATPR